MLIEAESNNIGYLEYTLNLFKAEATHREYNDVQKRLKAARLPHLHDLTTYDYSFENGLSKVRLNQLREFECHEQMYHLFQWDFPEPEKHSWWIPGADAVQKGYKAYFRTMEDIINMLKMKDFTALG